MIFLVVLYISFSAVFV